MSEKTGKPYLTIDDHCKLFMSKRDAEAFCQNIEEVFVQGPYVNKKESIAELMLSCKQAGGMFLDMCAGKKVEELKIGSSPQKYANAPLNSAIFHLKDTKKPVYLEKMHKCNFIVPCRIENGHEIMYGAAKFGDRLYTLCFSDLDEFATWPESNSYGPLEINFYELLRAAAGREIIINITGYRYVLTKEKIERIKKAGEIANAQKAERQAQKSTNT